MKTCRQIYEKIYKQNLEVLIRFNPGLAKDKFYIDRFRRAANLIAIQTTTKEWRKQ